MTKNVTVKVEKLTKFGFAMDGRYIGLSKHLSEADKTRLVPGATFEAEFYVSDSGKEYLNKIISAGAVVGTPPPSNPPLKLKTDEDHVAMNGPDVELAKKFTPKFTKKETPDNSMSKQEWQDKDNRISRQGVIQAAVIALAPVVSLELLPGEAQKLATSMLEFVKGV